MLVYIIYTHIATPERVQTLAIKEGNSGYSYAVVFDKCLDGNITWVEVDDPYIRARHQLHNFVRFCELLVKKCRKLARIHLTTTSSTPGESSGDVRRSNYILYTHINTAAFDVL